MARVAQLLAGIPHSVPLSTVNRQRSSGLQAFADVSAAINSGQYGVGIAAGVESVSCDDLMGVKPTLNWEAVPSWPPAARECLIPRALRRKTWLSTLACRGKTKTRSRRSPTGEQPLPRPKGGSCDAEIVPVPVPADVPPQGTVGPPTSVEKDDGTRSSATVESLAKLRLVFKVGGSTTAGNASQMTDGAASVLVMKRSTAAKLHLPILAVFKAFTVVGVPPAIMGVGPAFAIPVALAEAGLTVDDVYICEINEAFASQAIYCAQQLKVKRNRRRNPSRLRTHPLVCASTSACLHPISRVCTQSPVCAPSLSCGHPIKNGMAPHNIMAYPQPFLIVGCLCRFGVCTRQGMGLGCAKGQ
jgi:acetyl-CoA acyltransferase 1